MSESVRSIGATASLNHDGPEDDDFAVVDLRLFALTDGGEQIDDPQPASSACAARATSSPRSSCRCS